MIEDLPSLSPRKGSFKENFFGRMANQLRIIQEGALWAHLPTNTSRQMEFLQAVLEKDSAHGASLEERIWKIGGINVLQYLELDLAPRLRELPPQTLLIFFSDHGFIENPRFAKADKYRTSRYIHGEDSPFEVIVPWAIATKIQ